MEESYSSSCWYLDILSVLLTALAPERSKLHTPNVSWLIDHTCMEYWLNSFFNIQCFERRQENRANPNNYVHPGHTKTLLFSFLLSRSLWLSPSRGMNESVLNVALPQRERCRDMQEEQRERKRVNSEFSELDGRIRGDKSVLKDIKPGWNRITPHGQSQTHRPDHVGFFFYGSEKAFLVQSIWPASA